MKEDYVSECEDCFYYKYCSRSFDELKKCKEYIPMEQDYWYEISYRRYNKSGLDWEYDEYADGEW